jgi:thiamine pyrophosphate-dependent acetolactate synthase large subunit-like protein
VRNLATRLRRAEEIANPRRGHHVIFIPYDIVEMKGEAYERWKAEETCKAPPAAQIIFVRWRRPDEGGAHAQPVQ